MQKYSKFTETHNTVHNNNNLYLLDTLSLNLFYFIFKIMTTLSTSLGSFHHAKISGNTNEHGQKCNTIKCKNDHKASSPKGVDIGTVRVSWQSSIVLLASKSWNHLKSVGFSSLLLGEIIYLLCCCHLCWPIYLCMLIIS